MRELVTEGQEVLIIPSNYKNSVIGKVTEVRAGDFTLEVNKEPEILINTYCEFYTQTKHGKLYFDSYAKEIDGNKMIVASPAKHKFLQRRQYTRVKYVHDFDIYYNDKAYKISTLDISAGGMKLKTNEKFDIEGVYSVTVPVSETKSLNCKFLPIRIEKADDGGYVISGQFAYDSTQDKMVLTQFCAKRSYEIMNK